MNEWIKRNRPLRLEKRLEFENYEATRNFLDALGDFCEKKSKFPDISFGKTYVNLTIRPEQESDKENTLSSKDFELASGIDELI